MGELKTRPIDLDPAAFVAAIPEETTRTDCQLLLDMMKRISGAEPRMWGPKMIGFGSYHYRYDSGREGDWFLTGFSPRKKELTIYIMAGFDGYDEILQRLGRHKTGKSCLYVKRLEDVDLALLERLIGEGIEHVVRTYGRTDR